MFHVLAALAKLLEGSWAKAAGWHSQMYRSTLGPTRLWRDPSGNAGAETEKAKLVGQPNDPVVCRRITHAANHGKVAHQQSELPSTLEL